MDETYTITAPDGKDYVVPAEGRSKGDAKDWFKGEYKAGRAEKYLKKAETSAAPPAAAPPAAAPPAAAPATDLYSPLGFDPADPAVKDVANAFPRGLYKGATAAAGLGGDLREMGGAASEAVGLGRKPGEMLTGMGMSGLFYWAPTTEQIRDTVTSLTGYKPAAKAETPLGRYTEKFGEYMPLTAAGPESWLAKLGMAAGSSVLGETGGEIAEAIGVPRATGEIPGAMIGGGIAGLASVPARTRAGFDETLALFNRLGLIPTAATTGVGGRAAGIAESNLLPNLLGSSGRMETVQGGNLEKLFNKQQEIAAAYGAPKNKVDTGRDMQQTLINGYNSAKQEGGRIMEAISSAFSETDFLDAKALLAAVKKPIGSADTEIVKTLTASPATKEVQMILESTGGLLTFKDMKALKSKYADMLDPHLPKPPDKAQIGQIVKALDDDIESAVKSLGNPDALKDWHYAKAVYRNAETDFKHAFEQLIGTKDMPIKPEKVYELLVSKAGTKAPADIEAFETIWRKLGKQKQGDLAASVLAQMGNKDPELFGQLEGWGLPTFLTNYKNLSPQAKEILFRSTGNQQTEQALDDLVQAARKLSVWGNLASTSRSDLKSGMAGQAIMPALFAVTGQWAHLLYSMVVEIGGSAVAAQLLTRPASIKALAKTLEKGNEAILSTSRAALAAESNLQK